MTPQEIFDKVVTHLITQGVQAKSEDGDCLYRGPNGTKCAVGALISDKNYQKTMEGWGVSSVIERYKFPKYIKENIDLLYDLQDVHDEDHNWSKDLKCLKDALRYVADKYNLQYTKGFLDG